MTVLYINLAIVSFLSFFSRYYSKFDQFTSHTVKPNKLLALLVTACLVIVSGLRSNIGDTFFYKYTYVNNNFYWSDVSLKEDYGFTILQILLKKITNDPQLLIFITALLTNVLIVIVLYKYARIFELAIFLYITTGAYMVSMNGIRQYLAASILFIGTIFIVKGDWKKYIGIVILASSFHQTALILIPLYFIVRKKAWTSSTTIVMTIGIVFTAFFGQISTVLFTMIEDTQYGLYSNFDEGGANFIRVIINGLPLVLAYLKKEELRRLWPHIDIVVNMSIIGFVFMVISTQNWIFARFSIYFGLYNIILITWIVKLFEKRSQRLFYLSLIILYLLLHLYEYASKIHYESNYLIL
ncbi:EpsG family protein [Neobacillus sp. D3-1R]|uniref:EpsG family protein n=1 Tax=Neobacillus sp. D3-1R TaxID=3445778 RepID=UPI003FA01890